MFTVNLDFVKAKIHLYSLLSAEFLVLDSVPTEYNIQIKNIEMQLSIHNSMNVLNPYEYGHSLLKAHDNIFRLTRVSFESLLIQREEKSIIFL